MNFLSPQALRASRRTQFVSIHKLTCFGRDVGEIELVSVFVKRREKGKNRSITRIALSGFPLVERRLEFGHAAGIAAMIRADRWTEHFGFLRAGSREDAQLTIKPCPSQDFNGAGFLYFAAFQSFVDRAEWELLTMPGLAHLTTAARHVIYHGNIEAGDRVVVKLLGQRYEGDLLSHWFQIAREGRRRQAGGCFHASPEAVLIERYALRVARLSVGASRAAMRERSSPWNDFFVAQSVEQIRERSLGDPEDP